MLGSPYRQYQCKRIKFNVYEKTLKLRFQCYDFSEKETILLFQLLSVLSAHHLFPEWASIDMCKVYGSTELTRNLLIFVKVEWISISNVGIIRKYF